MAYPRTEDRGRMAERPVRPSRHHAPGPPAGKGADLSGGNADPRTLHPRLLATRSCFVTSVMARLPAIAPRCGQSDRMGKCGLFAAYRVCRLARRLAAPGTRPKAGLHKPPRSGSDFARKITGERHALCLRSMGPRAAPAGRGPLLFWVGWSVIEIANPGGDGGSGGNPEPVE